jgi:hypothetical protein
MMGTRIMIDCFLWTLSTACVLKVEILNATILHTLTLFVSLGRIQKRHEEKPAVYGPVFYLKLETELISKP